MGSQIETSRRGSQFSYDVPFPALSVNGQLSRDINAYPEEMWKRMYAENAFFGRLDSATLEDGQRLDWHVVYPRNQYVPGGPDGSIHFMMTPRLVPASPSETDQPTDRFFDIKDLPHQALLPPSKAMLAFLAHPSHNGIPLGGVNFSEDHRQEWKKSSRSWANLHFHAMVVPEHLHRQLPNEHVIWEPLADTMREATRGYFQMYDPLVKEKILTPLPPDEQSRIDLALRPETVALRFDGIPEAEQLASAFKSIDSTYRKLHEAIYRLFTSNFDEVQQSQWQQQYLLRSHDEVVQLLMKSHEMPWLPQQEHQSLLSFQKRLTRGYETHTEDLYAPEKREKIMKRRIFKSPTYSLTLVTQEHALSMLLCPHLVSPKGSVETVGLGLRRYPVPNMDTQPQQDLTRAAVQKTLGHLLLK